MLGARYINTTSRNDRTEGSSCTLINAHTHTHTHAHTHTYNGANGLKPRRYNSHTHTYMLARPNIQKKVAAGSGAGLSATSHTL